MKPVRRIKIPKGYGNSFPKVELAIAIAVVGLMLAAQAAILIAYSFDIGKGLGL